MKAPESERRLTVLFSRKRPVQVQADLTHLAFEVDSLEEFGKHIEALASNTRTGRISARTAVASRLSMRRRLRD